MKFFWGFVLLPFCMTDFPQSDNIYYFGYIFLAFVSLFLSVWIFTFRKCVIRDAGGISFFLLYSLFALHAAPIDDKDSFIALIILTSTGFVTLCYFVWCINFKRMKSNTLIGFLWVTAKFVVALIVWNLVFYYVMYGFLVLYKEITKPEIYTGKEAIDKEYLFKRDASAAYIRNPVSAMATLLYDYATIRICYEPSDNQLINILNEAYESKHISKYKIGEEVNRTGVNRFEFCDIGIYGSTFMPAPGREFLRTVVTLNDDHMRLDSIRIQSSMIFFVLPTVSYEKVIKIFPLLTEENRPAKPPKEYEPATKFPD